MFAKTNSFRIGIGLDLGIPVLCHLQLKLKTVSPLCEMDRKCFFLNMLAFLEKPDL